MEAIELIELIGRGEDSRTQFKQSQDVTNAQSLAGELAAFSNSKGGKILIGISDQGTVTGVSQADVIPVRFHNDTNYTIIHDRITHR